MSFLILSLINSTLSLELTFGQDIIQILFVKMCICIHSKAWLHEEFRGHVMKTAQQVLLTEN